MKLRLPKGCELCEVQTDTVTIQVVLDTEFEISNDDLTELIERCRYDIAREQEKRGKNISVAHGLVNQNRCHWVASLECFVLTDSEDYMRECYETLRGGSGDTVLVGGLN